MANPKFSTYADYIVACNGAGVKPKKFTSFPSNESIYDEIDSVLLSLKDNPEYKKPFYTPISATTSSFDEYVQTVEPQGVSKNDLIQDEKLIDYVKELNQRLDELKGSVSSSDDVQAITEASDLSDEKSFEKLNALNDDKVDSLVKAIQDNGYNQEDVKLASDISKSEIASTPVFDYSYPSAERADFVSYLADLTSATRESTKETKELNKEMRKVGSEVEGSSEAFEESANAITKASEKSNKMQKALSTRMLGRLKVSQSTQDSLMDTLKMLLPLLILWVVGKLKESLDTNASVNQEFSEAMQEEDPSMRTLVEDQIANQKLQSDVNEIVPVGGAEIEDDSTASAIAGALGNEDLQKWLRSVYSAGATAIQNLVGTTPDEWIGRNNLHRWRDKNGNQYLLTFRTGENGWLTGSNARGPEALRSMYLQAKRDNKDQFLIKEDPKGNITWIKYDAKEGVFSTSKDPDARTYNKKGNGYAPLENKVGKVRTTSYESAPVSSSSSVSTYSLGKNPIEGTMITLRGIRGTNATQSGGRTAKSTVPVTLPHARPADSRYSSQLPVSQPVSDVKNTRYLGTTQNNMVINVNNNTTVSKPTGQDRTQ